jgi:hypothetical protein
MVKSIYYGRHARHLEISYEREEKERERLSLVKFI